MPRVLKILPTTDLVEDSLTSVPTGMGISAKFDSAITFSELEETLRQSALIGRRRLPAGGRRLALDAILASAVERQGTSGADYRGWTSRAVEALLLELVAGGLDPAGENAFARVRPPLQARIAAFTNIVRAYLKRLTERGMGDADLAVLEACKALESGGPLPGRLTGFDAIEFHHVLDWRPGRVRIARALAQALKQDTKVVVNLPSADEKARPDAAEALAPLYEGIESAESELDIHRADLKPSTDVRTLDAADDAGEAREVAARVADLIREGAPLDSIALATSAMREAAPRFAEALADLGIPARVREGVTLPGTLVARLAVDLADWGRLEEITRERVCSVLSCEAIELAQFSSGEKVDALEVVRHVRAAAVRSRQPDRAGDGFSSRLERLARSCEAAEDPEKADRVRHSARTLDRFFKRVDARPASATIPRHADALCKLLIDLGVERWAMNSTDESAAVEQEAWTRLSESARELEETSALLSLRDRPVPRAAFVDWLRNLFDGASKRPGTSRGSAVELLELGDIAGRKFEHLFIVAASENRLPRRTSLDGALAEDERRQLNTALGRPVLSTAPGGSSTLLDSAAFALATDVAAHVTVCRARSDNRGGPLADTPLLPEISTHPIRESVPFAPLDSRLSGRQSASIQARQEIERSRASFFRGEGEAGAYDGDLHRLAALIHPLAAGSVERPWSASALERLAICPFRYLSEWAWRAKEEDEPDDVAGPMEVGRLAHLAAEHAVRAMLKATVWSSKEDSGVALGLVAAEKAVADAEHATVLGHPELWELTRAQMLKRLHKLLGKEIARTEESGVMPAEMELGFGRDGVLPAFEIAGVFVCGQVDRVDVGPTAALVLDYKSGRTSALRQKLSPGELFEVQLQLPLYAVALSELMPRARGLEMDAAYVSLRDLRRTKTVRETLDGMPFSEMRELLEDNIETVTAHVNEAKFPVRPHSCHGCHLQPVCRIPRMAP